MTISSFQGKHRWLSNFWSCFVVLDGVEYPSVENAYQAAKVLNKDERTKFETCLPSYAQRVGKGLLLRPKWSEVRLQIMEDLLRQKFNNNNELKKKLIETADEELIENNTWGDIFWGVYEGMGENQLGQLLMKIRKELKESEEFEVLFKTKTTVYEEDECCGGLYHEKIIYYPKGFESKNDLFTRYTGRKFVVIWESAGDDDEIPSLESGDVLMYDSDVLPFIIRLHEQKPWNLDLICEKKC